MPKKCNYREKNCAITHGGKKFEATGASVVGDRIVAYLGENGVLMTWHGKKIGTYRIISSWRNPRGIMSDWIYQVEATVKGIVFTGRSMGIGMVFTGKRKRGR